LNQEAEHKRQESKKPESEKTRQIRTHYDNLKVARNAPDALIKAAYKVLLQQHHPDKVDVAKQAEALRITKIIRASYDVLSDPVQRAEHDAWIKVQEANSRSHKPENSDINVNEAREKEEFRRHETEKEEAKKKRQAQERDDLKRREEEAKRKSNAHQKEDSKTGWYTFEKAAQAQPHNKEAENKIGCLPLIIGFLLCLVLINKSAELIPALRKIVKQESYESSPKNLGIRYRDNGDGTVKDLETNLEWMRCSLGQDLTSPTCVGEAQKYSWNDTTLTVGQRFEFAGHSNWRVPTIDELKTLVYCSSGQPQTWNNTGAPCEGSYEVPTIKSEVFPNTPRDWFWSSTSYTDYSNYSSYVYFYNGYSLNSFKNGYRNVRLVR
jgi:curved DNA-binding protein CbpA